MRSRASGFTLGGLRVESRGSRVESQNVILWPWTLVSRLSTLPDVPRRIALSPQRFKLALVTQRIHRPPEAAVLVRGQLPLAGQRLQRLALPRRRIAAADIVQAPGLEHKEPAVDPCAVAGRFLGELRD